MVHKNQVYCFLVSFEIAGLYSLLVPDCLLVLMVLGHHCYQVSLVIRGVLVFLSLPCYHRVQLSLELPESLEDPKTQNRRQRQSPSPLHSALISQLK